MQLLLFWFVLAFCMVFLCFARVDGISPARGRPVASIVLMALSIPALVQALWATVCNVHRAASVQSELQLLLISVLLAQQVNADFELFCS